MAQFTGHLSKTVVSMPKGRLQLSIASGRMRTRLCESSRRIRITGISVLTLAMMGAAGYPGSSPKNEKTQIAFFDDPSSNANENAPARPTATVACQGTGVQVNPKPGPGQVVPTIPVHGHAEIFNHALTIDVDEVSDDAVKATVNVRSWGSCILGPAKPGTAYAYQGYIIQVGKVQGGTATFIVESTHASDAGPGPTYTLWIGAGFVLLLVIYLVVTLAKKQRFTPDQRTRRTAVGFTLLLVVFLIVTFFLKGADARSAYHPAVALLPLRRILGRLDHR